jgi:hypothetical protein
MADDKITLMMDNSGNKETCAMMNGAILRTIFQLANCHVPEEDMAKVKSDDPMVFLTISGSKEALDKVADLASRYNGVAVVSGEAAKIIAETIAPKPGQKLAP